MQRVERLQEVVDSQRDAAINLGTLYRSTGFAKYNGSLDFYGDYKENLYKDRPM